MKLPENLLVLGASLETDFNTMKDATQKIREKLQKHSDGKLLKGDEVTGCLGEVYGKMILNGKLVDDRYDYDVAMQDKRVSVKARKGRSWQQSSSIPRIEGDECPTHLMFLRFKDDYTLQSVWLFSWEYLKNNGRFKQKNVRGGDRSYYIRIKPSNDKEYLIYSE